MSNDGNETLNGPMSRNAARNSPGGIKDRLLFEDRSTLRIDTAAKRTARQRRSLSVDILGKLCGLFGLASIAASLGDVVTPTSRQRPGFYPPVGFKCRNQRQKRRDARRSGRPVQRNR